MRRSERKKRRERLGSRVIKGNGTSGCNGCNGSCCGRNDRRSCEYSIVVMEPVDVMGAMGALMVEIIDAVVNIV